MKREEEEEEEEGDLMEDGDKMEDGLVDNRDLDGVYLFIYYFCLKVQSSLFTCINFRSIPRSTHWIIHSPLIVLLRSRLNVMCLYIE